MRSEMNEVLVRTGPDTPVGELMRRYWVPVMLQDEIPEADCPPVRVKVLGEQLLAFRDSSGRPGLIDEFCAHRGVSLFYGRNEEGGVRCAYHGWKYDISGQCIDLPSDPSIASRMRVTSYPCIDHGGIVWAYMGPAELQPPPPELEWCTVPDSHRFISRRSQESNYLQGLEGGIDTTHVSFVHRYELDADILHKDAECTKYIKADPNVVFTVKKVPAGLTIFGRRNGEADSYYWRVTQMIFPWSTLVPLTGPNPLAAHMWVPIDDENCWVWNINYYPHQPLSDEERREMEAGKGIHAPLIEGSFRPVANKDNNYLIDRKAQREKRMYSGIGGLGMQDTSLQESMGPIQNRSRENLVKTDLAIVLARRSLYDAAMNISNGAAPPALDPASQHVRAASVLLPKDVDVETWASDALIAEPGNPLYSL